MYKLPPQTAQKAQRSRTIYLNESPAKMTLSKSEMKYPRDRSPSLAQPVKMMHSPSWMQNKAITSSECPFSFDNMQNFKQRAFEGSPSRRRDAGTKIQNQNQVYSEILTSLPNGALTREEIRVISHELDKAEISYQQFSGAKAANAASSASMISMIFRFFLQSGEYNFFIRRLKNVVSNQTEKDLYPKKSLNDNSSIEKREIISISKHAALGSYPTMSQDETKAFTPSSHF